MDAIQLFAANGLKHSPVFMCQKCGRLATREYQAIRSSDGEKYTPEERDEFARQEAERCCNHRCQICGEPAAGEWQKECKRHQQERWSREAAEKEAALYAKAIKIPATDWDDSAMLYSEQGDRWFRDLEEALDWYADDEERSLPAYLWIGRRVHKTPDLVGWVMDHLSDDYDDEASNRVSDEALARLTTFFAIWWKENEPESYDVDYRRCVVLNKEAAAQR